MRTISSFPVVSFSRDNERILTEINKKIKGLEKPQTEVDHKVKEKVQALKNYEKDKVSLDFTTKQLAVMKEKYGVLTQHHHALKEAFQKVDLEKQELYRTFEDTGRCLYDQLCGVMCYGVLHGVCMGI
jgi:septal ring factor EnvC (AmiA/AmiB activator)